MNVDREISFIQTIQHFEKDISRAEGNNAALNKLVNDCASKIESNLDLCTLHSRSFLTAFSHIKQITKSQSSSDCQAKVQTLYNKILNANIPLFKQEMEAFLDRVRDEGGEVPPSFDYIANPENQNNLDVTLKAYFKSDEGIDFVMQHGNEDLLREILFITEIETDAPLARKMVESAIDHDNASAVKALVGSGVPLHQVMAHLSVNTAQTNVTRCLKSLIKEDATKLSLIKGEKADTRIHSGPSKPKGEVLNYLGQGLEAIKLGGEILEGHIAALEETGEDLTKKQKEEIKDQKNLLKQVNLVGKTGGFIKALMIAFKENPKLKDELESFVKEKNTLQEELKNNPERAFEIEEKIKTVEQRQVAFVSLVANMHTAQKISVLEKGIGLTTGAIKYAKAADKYLITMKSLTLIGSAAASWQNWLGYKEGSVKAQHLNQVRNSVQEARKELIELKSQYPQNSAIHTLIELKRQQLNAQLTSLEQEEKNLSQKGYFLIGATAAGLLSVCAIATAAFMYGVKTSEQENDPNQLQQAEYTLLTVGWGLGLVAKHLPAIPEGKLLGSIIGGKLGELADNLAQPIWSQAKVSLAQAALEREKSGLSETLERLETAWIDGDRSTDTYYAIIETQKAFDEIKAKIEKFESSLKGEKGPTYESLVKERKELEEARDRLDKAWMEGDRSQETYDEHTSTYDRLNVITPLIPKMELAKKLGLQVNEVEERLAFIQKGLLKEDEKPFLEEFLTGLGINASEFQNNPAEALLTAFKT